MVSMVHQRHQFGAKRRFEPRPLPEPVGELVVRRPSGHNCAHQPPSERLALVLEMETAHFCAGQDQERHFVLNAPADTGAVFNLNPAIVNLAFNFKRVLRKLDSPVIKLRGCQPQSDKRQFCTGPVLQAGRFKAH